MKNSNKSKGGADLKTWFYCLGKKSRKENRSEDVSISSVMLNTEIDSMINYDSLEQSQGASAHSVPLSAETRCLIIPDHFEYSNERREERSEDASV